MDSRPTVSVIVTSYNYGRFIGQAIESVLSQDFRDIELLVCDNASTDDSAEVISRYVHDERMLFIRRPENIGAAANAQDALERATGRYVTFLSADDFYLSGHLRTMVRYYEDHPDVDIAYAGYVLANPDGTLRDGHFSKFLDARNRNDFASLLTYDMYPCLETILFKRELIDECGPTDPAFVAGDLEYVVRFAAAGKRFASAASATIAWRLHGDNMSGGKYVRNGDQLEDQLRLLEKYVNEENARKVIGYGAGILRMLELKHAMFSSASPQLAAERSDDIERRKAAIGERVRAYSTRPIPPGPGGPLVSVIMPTLGNVALLSSALQSLAAQTYPNWELVLVSDGGPDLSHFLGAHAFKDRITYVRRAVRGGPAAARNNAFDFIHGGIVAYLDDDNRWDPRHLEVVTGAISVGALAVRTEAVFVVEQLDAAPAWRRDILRSRRPFATAAERPDAYLSHAVPLDAVAHDVRCYQQFGSFDPSFTVLDDWEFYLRLQGQFTVVPVGECTVEVRMRPALAGQQLGSNWAAFPAAIEKIYNAHLLSPTGTPAEARLALFKNVSEIAAQALRAPEDVEKLEALFCALAGRPVAAPRAAAHREAVAVS